MVGPVNNAQARALTLLRCALAVGALIAIPDAWAAAPWVDTRQSGPFICQATFVLTEYEPLLAELQELQPELVRTLGITPATEPMYFRTGQHCL
jgi:hypothetical protein